MLAQACKTSVERDKSSESDFTKYVIKKERTKANVIIKSNIEGVRQQQGPGYSMVRLS